MIKISEAEILRRLKLIRDTRKKFIEKYNLTKDEVNSYTLLDDLDCTEYIKVKDRQIEYGRYTNSETVTHFDPIKDAMYNKGELQCYWGDSTTVYGKFEKRLGYIFVSEEILKEDCTDEKILEIEEKEFDHLIHFLKYHYSSSLPYKERRLAEIQEEIDVLKKRISEIDKIAVDRNAV